MQTDDSSGLHFSALTVSETAKKSPTNLWSIRGYRQCSVASTSSAIGATSTGSNRMSTMSLRYECSAKPSKRSPYILLSCLIANLPSFLHSILVVMLT